MNILTKEKLVQALGLSGFENWVSPVDAPNLHRPPARPPELSGQGRVAAVLVLLYPTSQTYDRVSGKPGDGFDISLVLTKRNTRLSSHAGQISFPGGGKEANETLWQTACRETFEEIGVGRWGADSQAEEIELIGRLNPIYIPPSDFTVSPFVGWQGVAPEFICAPEEVELVIETSLSHLLDPETLKIGEVVSANSGEIEVPFYEVGEHRVWGATAIILSELLERFRRIPNDSPRKR